MAAVLEELTAIPEWDIPPFIDALEKDDDAAMVDKVAGAYNERGEQEWDTDDDMPLALQAAAPARLVTAVR